MSMSYEQIAVIGNMTNDELLHRYNTIEQYEPIEDWEDEENALLLEMETRGLSRP